MEGPMRPTLRVSLASLVAFVAVEQRRSFSSAARDLGIDQGAISRHVMRLEGELGIRLFDRSTRDIRLTPAGHRLLPQIRAAIEMLDAALAAVRPPSSSTKLRIRSSLPTFSTQWLIPRLHKLRQETGLTVELLLSEDPPAVDEDVDVWLTRNLQMPPHFVRCDIVEEKLVCVGSPSLLANGTIDRRNAQRVPFIVMTSRPDIFPRWLSETGWPLPNIVSSVDRTYMAIRAATAGLGALVVPDVLIAEESKSGLLVPLSAATLVSGWRYALYFDPDRARSHPEIAAFGDWVRREIDAQAGETPAAQ
jgi:DNA-binding transcriptional LysR family regulator